jgi:hypothetical protein
LNDGSGLGRAMLHLILNHCNVRLMIDAVRCGNVRSVCAVSDWRIQRAIWPEHGFHPDQADDRSECARTIFLMMMMCSHCGGSDNFAVRAGLPAESGFGGGIVIFVSVWSCNRDKHGNLMLGVRVVDALIA